MAGIQAFVGELARDNANTRFQAFIHDPSKQQVPFALAAASKVFKVGAGGDVDITGWIVIKITPSTTNLTAWFNADTTKTFTVWGGMENIILLHPSSLQLTINGTDARIEVGGM
jgi:hypothetical protein